ncbi:alpha/beta hydrolase, partial [bacterium]|nr:alpha/beta hydrolase [bacterium]
MGNTLPAKMTDLWWSRQPGAGSPLVLVPGIGGAASHMGALAAALGGQDLIRFDPRGCGQSPVLGAEATLTGLLDDLEGVLDAADTPRAIIVGNSFGGVLARLLAVERPARVAGLVLVGTGMGTTAPRAPTGRVAKGGGAKHPAAWLEGYGAPGWRERNRAGFLAAAKSLAHAPA